MPEGTLLVRGGTVVTATGQYRSDVRVVGGRIAEVAPDLEVSGPTFDAGGLHVLPGVIDAHHHQWEPGLASRSDFRDDTASAVAGGITTILDHPLTPPEVLDGGRFREKVALGQRTSLVDFGLHGGASPDRLDGLADQWAAGATGFKFFTCNTGVAMQGFVQRRDREALLDRLAALGAIALVHAEDQAIMDRNQKQLQGTIGRLGEIFGAWRSGEAELVAAREVLDLARSRRASLYFVHTSQPAIVDLVVDARGRGEPVWVETCPHYLRFTDVDLAERGSWIATAPPVRDEEARSGLIARLAVDIDTVGSDHGSVLQERKEITDPFRAQAGVPGNETIVPLMLDLAAAGAITLERLTALLARNPARIFGIDDRKGRIEAGLDGDLTIVDTKGKTVPKADQMVGVARWTPYEGLELRGRVAATIIRGTLVAQGGMPDREPGFGRFVRRGAPRTGSSAAL
jgi:dihydroorotase (multifunctional complex type)